MTLKFNLYRDVTDMYIVGVLQTRFGLSALCLISYCKNGIGTIGLGFLTDQHCTFPLGLVMYYFTNQDTADTTNPTYPLLA